MSFEVNIERRMDTVLFIARLIVLFWTSGTIFQPCLVALGTRDIVRETLFERNADMEEVSAEKMLWHKPKKSYVSCAAFCSQDDNCTVFKFSLDFGICFGFADTLMGKYTYNDLEATINRDAVDSLNRYNAIKTERQHVFVPCSGLHKLGEGFYFFSDDRFDWDSARHRCLNMGGHLLAIETNEERMIIDDFVLSQCGNKDDDIWIGGHDHEQEWVWEWVGIGQTLGYTNWYPGNPDNWEEQDCMLLKWGWFRSTLWDDETCEMENPYICEMLCISVIEPSRALNYPSTKQCVVRILTPS